jgi:FkbM family methyltransferase
MRKDGLHYLCDRSGVTLTMLGPQNNDFLADNDLGYGFSYGFKKAVWDTVKFRDIDWNEDGEFCQRAKSEFKLSGIHDTSAICLHVLHETSTSRCFPQHHLPEFLFRKLFPTLYYPASPASNDDRSTMASLSTLETSSPHSLPPNPERKPGDMEDSLRRTNGTVVKTTVHGIPISFFVNNADDHIQAFHMKGQFYENEELSIIAKHCAPGSFIADVGANVGNHALFFEKFLQPRSVKVFEVNGAVIDILNINVLLNQCTKIDTSCLGVGLAESEMTLEIMLEESNNVGGTRFGRSDAGSFRALPGDTMLIGQPVNFIKMDIEGMEMQALRGLERTIQTWRPAMFVEIGNENVDEFNQWIQARGYKIVDSYRRYRSSSNYMAVWK